MKTVLIIAYDFPPARTSGVYRPLKFARYLPDFGWRPIILTVKNIPGGTIDESLLRELPEICSVYRAYSVEPKRFEQYVFKKLFGPNTQSTQSLQPSSIPSFQSKSLRSLKQLIKSGLFSPVSRFTHNYMYNPDDKVGWIPMAVRTGLQAIRKESVAVIYSTSPPETNHLVGKWLNRISRKPWVVDFRDPWSDNVIRQDNPYLRRERERTKERIVLTRADRIINVGHRFSTMAKESFSEVNPDNHTVITNGYDESDFAGLDAQRIYDDNQTDYLNILNVGSIYGNSAFNSFLTGFKEAIEHHPDLNCRVSFVGDVSKPQQTVLTQPPLSRYARLLGYKNHREAVKLMMAADVLLLMPSGGDARTSDKIIPGKVFELMRAARPIFMIGWPGETTDMILRSGLGCFVEESDIDNIVAQLVKYSKLKQNEELTVRPNWEYICQYERRNLTERLSVLLDELYYKNRKGSLVSHAEPSIVEKPGH